MMLADRWWTLVVHGAAAVIFAILTFIAPKASLLALVVLFGAYAIVGGVTDVVLGVRTRAGEPRWGWLVFEGIASILAGAITFLWPGITAVVMLVVIAIWAIATGVAQVVSAVRLRKLIRGEWLLALTGLLSIAFGVLLLLYPGAGALAVTLWIGAYALVIGALLIALGLRLRSWGRSSTREAPPGAIPVTR
jgi:uncharacterized membrane protein HdeD (DUF308 family)